MSMVMMMDVYTKHDPRNRWLRHVRPRRNGRGRRLPYGGAAALQLAATTAEAPTSSVLSSSSSEG